MTTEILLLISVLAGFYMAWNIGANDVANAMGTSVGSGALTLKRAVIVAAIFEFSGAFFFGSHVSETIQKGLIDASIFAGSPMVLFCGMLASLCASGLWLQIASYFGWPVSTTHSIVGAVVGFGCVVGGVDAVYWSNVVFVGLSWIVSPLFGGVVAYGMFIFLKHKIFYSSHPIKSAIRYTPPIVFTVSSMLSLLFLYKGLENLHLDLSIFSALAFSLFIGGIGFVVSYFCVRRLKPEEETLSSEFASVEKIFAYLQIMSACLMAFAHGANDVANAIGPLAACISILHTGYIAETAVIPLWTLALGGVGIIAGLATWGWRVIETIGKKITELTPTRGFAVEFGAAATILVASRLGLPISTTHTLVGAVIGVGLARGFEALNLATMRDIFISWIVTVPAGALLSVILFYIFKMLLSV